MYKYADLLDVNTLYSNDVNMMLRYYGIEACARVIVKVRMRGCCEILTTAL